MTDPDEEPQQIKTARESGLFFVQHNGPPGAGHCGEGDRGSHGAPSGCGAAGRAAHPEKDRHAGCNEGEPSQRFLRRGHEGIDEQSKGGGGKEEGEQGIGKDPVTPGGIGNPEAEDDERNRGERIEYPPGEDDVIGDLVEGSRNRKNTRPPSLDDSRPDRDIAFWLDGRQEFRHHFFGGHGIGYAGAGKD